MSHQDDLSAVAGLHPKAGEAENPHAGLDEPNGRGESPAPSRGYRIRRRNRPTHVSTGIAREVDIAISSVDGETFGRSSLFTDHDMSNDIPLPTIESSAPSTPGFFITEGFPDDDTTPNALSDSLSVMTGLVVPPRTPSPNMTRDLLLGGWSKSQLDRAASSDSLSSLASSQGSSFDSGTWSAVPGTCSISPESEVDPTGISKGSLKLRSRSLHGSTLRRNSSEDWTPAMDQHIWKVYNAYLADPTVTPYRFEPGTPPPSGVSHRVARKVRRTWSHAEAIERSFSDQTREAGSGSVTPKASMQNFFSQWPKSGNATRDRLRTLCQRFGATDPFEAFSRSMSPRASSRHSPTPRSAGFASSLPDNLTANFARDVHLSLMTSTSETMQPDGPLARLTAEPITDSGIDIAKLPPVPFASPAAIPSSRLPSSDLVEMEVETANPTQTAMLSSPGPRLGSPFSHHSWAASNPFQASEPRRQRIASVQSSGLQSPIRLELSLPESKMSKRRATHDLDDDSPPPHPSLAQAALIDVLGPSDASLRRRVRARGQAVAGSQNPRLGATFGSLSKATTTLLPTPLTGSLSNLPLDFPLARPTTASTTGRLAALPGISGSPRRLLSPFEGISGRPARSRGQANGGRHPQHDAFVGSADPFGP